MRKVLALVLFMALSIILLGYAAAQAAYAAVPDEGQRDCVMESGTQTRQHHAILFKAGDAGISSPARAQTVRSVEVPTELALSEIIGERLKTFKTSNVSRQAIHQQNIVERK